MTDTVNVPREWLEWFLGDWRIEEIKRNEIRAMLSAPKAEQPEAQKGEQEPVAYVSRKGFTNGGLVWTKAGIDADLPDETKLHTHPAPASDELLKALEAEIDRLRPHYQGRGLDQARVQILDHFTDFIAKHKGPQS